MRALFDPPRFCRARNVLTLLGGLAALVCAITSARAQQAERSGGSKDGVDYRSLGYIRFVNATGYGGKLRVFLDAQDINPPGYEDGFATAAVGFVPKTFQIELKHETLGEYKLSVTLKPGEVTSVVALPVVESSKAKTLSASEANDEKPKVELGGHVLSSVGYVRGKEVSVTVLQATIAEKLEVKIGSVAVTCVKLEPLTVSLGNGAGEVVPVSVGDKPLLTLNFVDPSDRIVILFPNEDGVIKNITLNNEVF